MRHSDSRPSVAPIQQEDIMLGVVAIFTVVVTGAMVALAKFASDNRA